MNSPDSSHNALIITYRLSFGLLLAFLVIVLVIIGILFLKSKFPTGERMGVAQDFRIMVAKDLRIEEPPRPTEGHIIDDRWIPIEGHIDDDKLNGLEDWERIDSSSTSQKSNVSSMKNEFTGYAIVDKEGLLFLAEGGRPWISTDFVVATQWQDNIIDVTQKQVEVKTVKITIQH